MIRVIGPRREPEPKLVVEYDPPLVDPTRLPGMQGLRARLERNRCCWDKHTQPIYEEHRGKSICFAGGEYFVADSIQGAIALASAAHPEDDAYFVVYVPPDPLPKD